jgi:glycosyltransferase involved in cell wall biosynthesis
MKIAVYTIALNEEKHVERWYESAKDADYLLIADTGSTDKTVKIAKKLGINVIKISVKPWRFDDSRNAALAALPEDIDYCVSIDMDEVLSDNWREHLEKMTSKQVEYKFNVTWRDEAEENVDMFFINNRIHARHGFRWNYFIHESLLPDRSEDYSSEFCEGLEISHHPDRDKSREQYNQMIEDAYRIYKNARFHIYQGMQLMSFNRFEEASEVWKSFIKLEEPIVDFELASAWRLLYKCSLDTKVSYLKKSLKIKKTRETYLDLAIHYYKKENWWKCFKYSKLGMDITSKPSSLFTNKFAYGYLLENVHYAAKYNKKIFKFSKKYRESRRRVNVESAIAHNFKLFND